MRARSSRCVCGRSRSRSAAPSAQTCPARSSGRGTTAHPASQGLRGGGGWRCCASTVRRLAHRRKLCGHWARSRPCLSETLGQTTVLLDMGSGAETATLAARLRARSCRGRRSRCGRILRCSRRSAARRTPSRPCCRRSNPPGAGAPSAALRAGAADDRQRQPVRNRASFSQCFRGNAGRKQGKSHPKWTAPTCCRQYDILYLTSGGSSKVFGRGFSSSEYKGQRNGEDQRRRILATLRCCLSQTRLTPTQEDQDRAGEREVARGLRSHGWAAGSGRRASPAP